MSLAALSFFALMVTSNLTAQHVEPNLCSNKCMCLGPERLVSCSKDDRIRAIPTNIENSISRFIIQESTFDNPTLYRHNLTGLEHLTYFKVIYCNLRFISSRAFKGMSKLVYLDLSHNMLIKVAPRAFIGLILKELHVTENYNVYFDSNAFYNMTVVSINMRSNNVRELNYDLFKDTKVRSLYLYNNQIRTIDPRFKILFHDFDTLLDVSNNPLICDCSLSWLAKVLELRYSSRKSLIKNDRINISCHMPKELLSKELMYLTPADLKCSPLKIEEVKVHITSDTTELTCLSKVGGSSPPNLTWLYYLNDYDRKVIEASKGHSKFHVGKEKSESSTSKSIRLTSTLFKKGVKKFICLASTDRDSFQKLEIHIHDIRRFLNITKSNYIPQILDSQKETNMLFIKHFSILELLGAVLGTFSATFVGLMVLLRYLKLFQDKLMSNVDFIDQPKTLNSIKPYYNVPKTSSSTYSTPTSNQDYENPLTINNLTDLTTIYPSFSYDRYKIPRLQNPQSYIKVMYNIL